MADLRTKILNKYNIDVERENVFNLYKINKADISTQELDTCIADTRKRWQSSINGANEKNAERDRSRLEKADSYEAILQDPNLRKKLFIYYNKEGHPKNEKTSQSSGSTGFARKYFEIIATTKKIKKSDVDFFFQYYQSERKNKKAIFEMLDKELKVKGFKEGKEQETEDEKETEGKKKDESSPLITNLFQEATILKIRKAFEKYEEAGQNTEVCLKYPGIQGSLYDFICLKDIDTVEQFKKLMMEKGKEAYAVRQEKGAAYIPLVDMFNIFQDIADYKDVVDNISEFKLLLEYPSLTPYMFAFVEVKPVTIHKLLNIANENYSFKNETDFILNYYKPIYDNFGITNDGIGAILRKAEREAKQNRFLNNINEKLGRKKNKKRTSFGARIIYWLVYWPIFIGYLLFEIIKLIFTRLRLLTYLLTFFSFCFTTWLLPRLGIDNLFALRKLFHKEQWVTQLSKSWEVGQNPSTMIISSIGYIVFLLVVSFLPSLFIYKFFATFSEEFNKLFDWIGIERTFQQIIQTIKKRTEEQILAKKAVGKIVVSLVCTVALFSAIVLLPIGIKEAYKTMTHSSDEYEIDETDFWNDPLVEKDGNHTDDFVEDYVPVEEVVMVITENSSNIRSGPGTGYEIIATADKGATFIATGKQEKASNGSVWYEIYIDKTINQTGWASQKVIGFQ